MAINYPLIDGWAVTGFRKRNDNPVIALTLENSGSQLTVKYNVNDNIFLSSVPFELYEQEYIDLTTFTNSFDAVKPWGSYKTLHITTGFLIKEITIAPNQRFSLQYHNYRSELWTVISGSGFVELNAEKTRRDLTIGDTVEIAVQQIHRMTAGDNGMIFNEIQYGETIDENDIVRLEDDYGRV